MKATGLTVPNMVMVLTVVQRKHLLVFGKMDKLLNKNGHDIF
jgi:hypothetical protein